MRGFRAQRLALAALILIGAMTACSGSGCGNCAVPGFTTAVPTPGPFITPTPAPGPIATGSPVPLSCAQNALSGQGVPLGTASTFAVLAGSTVTSTGLTVVTGDLGVSPGTAITGFTGFPPGGPGIVTGGSIHSNDPVAMQAQLDLTTAFNSAAGRVNAIGIGADIGGLVIPPGVYKPPTSLQITGNVTLDGQNNPNSVFIFQIASTLTTSVNSSVTLINNANACNVFWQAGSSATLNATTVFNGNILALASISLGTGTVVNGRLLARNGAVTMLSNLVTKPGP